MENRRFRSRSESPPRRTQISDTFVACREWVERVKLLVTEVRGQIEAYQILLENDATHPPTYLIQGLLQAVSELEGPEKKPKSPIAKARTTDGMQNVNGQVVEEVTAEQENNTENRMDENQVKTLLNKISQQVNDNSSVTTKYKCSRYSPKTLKRMVGDESGGNSFGSSQPRKVNQATGVRPKSKPAELKVKAGNKNISCSNSSSGDGKKENEKDRRRKINEQVVEKEKAGQENTLEEEQKKENTSTTRRSAGPNDSSSGGTSVTAAKRARVYMETDTDSATSNSSMNVSAPTCSFNSSHEKRDFIQVALKEPKVLSTIMSNLRTSHLIHNCRLVNSSWKETANSILTKRRDLKAIDLRFEEEKGAFVLNSFKHHELSELQNILENSTNFPCDDFKIDGPLDHPDLQKFLSSCGGQIRNLDLELQGNGRIESVISCFRNLLTQQAVNLNSVVFREPWLEEPKPRLFSSPTILQKLSHIELPGRWEHSDGFSWTKEFLDAARNLRSFRTSDAKIMKSLVNLNKSYLLSEMNFNVHDSCSDDERITSQFKLKKLNYDFDQTYGYPRGKPNIFRRVLNANVDTLTSISLEFCDAVECLQTTKAFHHVKSFCLLGLEIESSVNQDSNKISLQNLFPNLEAIRLEGCFNEEYHEFHTEKNFPFSTSEPMEKVKTLEVRHVCPPEWLKLLPQLVPNVVHLILENYWDFPRSGHLFWAFTSLKSMDLGTLLGVKNLDSVFTGFSIETCKRLREKSLWALLQLLGTGVMDIEPEAEIEQLRVTSSIVQLKGLQELRIKVADTEPYVNKARKSAPASLFPSRSERRWGPTPQEFTVDLLSPVTSIYAFGMMPSLQAVDVLLAPREEDFLPRQKTGGMSRLQELAAALTPMAEHPLVTLYPIQMNNEAGD